MIRKNISLFEEDMKKIEGIVEKHEGNLSAAMREIIDFVDFMQRRFGNLDAAKKVERKAKGICVPPTLLNWFLTYTDGCLPDEITADCVEEITAIESMSKLAEIADMGFSVAIKIDADDERNPSEATIQISGERMSREFIAKITSCFLAKNRGMVVKDVNRRATATIVKLEKGWETEEKMEEEDYKKMRESLIKHFGERHIMMQEILNKPRFWNEMINATAEWGDVERYRYPKLYMLR